MKQRSHCEDRKPVKHSPNAKPIPHIPLPFEEVMKDVLKVKPPEKPIKPRRQRNATRGTRGASNT
jgi:hypothetical protein